MTDQSNQPDGVGRYRLITGVTGLLGDYLLRDFTAQNQRVAVLVRKSRRLSAVERIDSQLSHWERQWGRQLPRPVVLEGDITQPLLGLDAGDVAWVKQNCGSMLHSAASLMFEEQDGQPWKSNVDGVRNVLELCRAAGIRALDHISTSYVCGLRSGLVRETELHVGQQFGNPYEESKAQAEQLVHQATHLDTFRIFRPSIIVGDSQTGFTSTFHGFYTPLRIVAGLLGQVSFEDAVQVDYLKLLGMNGDERKNFVPVDYVASAIAGLIFRDAPQQQTYAVVSRNPVKVRRLLDTFIRVGAEANKNAAAAGDAGRKARGQFDMSAYQSQYVDQFSVYRSYWRDDPDFDDANTRRAVPDIHCPELTDDVLSRLCEYALQANFGFPPPPYTPPAFSLPNWLSESAQKQTQQSPAASLLQINATGPGGGQFTVDLTTQPYRFTPGLTGDNDEAELPATVFEQLTRNPSSLQTSVQQQQVQLRGDSAADKLSALVQKHAFTTAPTPATPKRSDAASEAVNYTGADDDAIAIVGMACRLPGASDLQQYWDLIVSGGDATGQLPEEVINRELLYHPEQGKRGKSYSTMGGLIDRRPFDNAKCQLPDEILRASDPVALTACEVAFDALVDAGFDPHGLASTRAGVYFGHTCGSEMGGDLVYSMYSEKVASLLRQAEGLGRLSKPQVDDLIDSITSRIQTQCDHRRTSPEIDLSANHLSQLVSRAFKFDGPSLVVDAACASSLQALAIGARALLLGDVDMVVTGGASHCKSDSLVLFSAARSVTAGKTCPFDANASGLVTAEGYVTLVLKRLSDAVADGDRIRGVLRGIGMSADGKGKSLWAPLPTGQKIAMDRAYPADFAPEEVQYIEAHATSTQVGDATELSALAAVFPPLPEDRKIPLGSVKGNIGHTLETAGVAGLVKAVLAMENATIPPVANLTTPNPAVDWEQMPFYLPRTKTPWQRPQNGARRAAVNSFGIGGLNVHVVLEEYIAGKTPVGNTLSGPQKREPVAIVGMGAIAAGALDLDAFEKSLQDDASNITEVDASRWSPAQFYRPAENDPYKPRFNRGGFIKGYEYDWRRHKVPPKQVANANPLQFMLLDATESALKQAKFFERETNRDRVGVVVGAYFAGDFQNELQAGLRLPEFGKLLREELARFNLSPAEVEQAVASHEDVLLREMPALLDETGSFTSSTLASRITKTFNLKGGALALDSGENSSLAAINAAINALQMGECDLMICAAGQRSMDLHAFINYSCDPRRDLFPPGEGCGVLTLKRLSDAQRDGDEVLGIVHGAGFSSSWAQQNPAATAAARAAAIAGVEQSSNARLDIAAPSESDYGQFTSQAAGALKTAPNATRSALAGKTGHTGSAQGMLATIRSTLSLPVDGAETAIVSGANSTYSSVLLLEPSATVRNKITVKQSATTAMQQPPEIVRAEAADWLTLKQQLTAGALTMGNRLQRFSAAGRVRVAFVSHNPAELQQQCQLAASYISGDGIAQPADLWNRGIYAAGNITGPTTSAIVFPGQGSAFAGMLGGVFDALPQAREAKEIADAALAELGYGSFDQIAGKNAADPGADIWTSQLATLLSGFVISRTLSSLGLQPAVVAGHSFGEYAALVSTGVCGLTDAIRAARRRSDSIRQFGSGGAMAALSVSSQEAEATIAGLGGLYIANRNAPDQTVIAGSPQQVDAAVAATKSQGRSAIRLNVPGAFHTPLMQQAADNFSRLIRQIELRDAATPVISTATAMAMQQREEIYHSLVTQLTSPVNWSNIAGQVLSYQPAVVIEAGPKPTLTKLNGKCYPAQQELFISTGQKSTSEAASLLGVIALAECRGCLDERPPAPPAGSTQAPRREGRLLEFDATARRKDRMRAKSAGVEKRPAPRRPMPASTRNGTHQAPAQPAPAPSTPVANVPSPAPAPQQAPAPSVATATVTVPQPVASPSAIAVETPAPDRATIRSLLVDFVVEQTGYPEEIVEMDADLEADLGIDSIKKAQLFGEIGAEFNIAPRADLSLDDFPTLNHVLEFICDEVPGDAAPASSVSVPAAAAPPMETPAPQPVAEAEIPATPQQSSAADTAGLQQMLVDFVVEQTGYPEEIVEMDADLEADLGIDSIKKAQLFGEIGAEFDIAPRADLSLDDFPTLNDVLNFLVAEIGGTPSNTPEPASAVAPAAPVAQAPQPSPAAQSPAPAQPQAAANVEVADAPQVAQLQAMLIDFVVEQTGYPEDIVEMDADLEADLGIDSIKKAQLFGEIGAEFDIAPRTDLSLDDFPTLSHVLEFLTNELGVQNQEVASPAAVSQPPAASPAIPPAATINNSVQATVAEAVAPESSVADVSESRLRNMLVDFVVEQTGYPEDIVEMDADLEADLGIDSIKKAQLFGEIGAEFDIAPRTDLSLDDFPTLGHVLEFLQAELNAGSGAGEVAANGATTAETPATEIAPAPPATMQRHVMEMMVAPSLIPEQRYLPGDTICVIGDRTGAAAAALQPTGCHIVSLDAVNLPAGMANLLAGATPTHLVFCLEDNVAPAESFTETAFAATLEACRLWIDALESQNGIDRASLAAITRMGGNFAFTSGGAFQGGGFTGLFKGIRREYPAMQVKVVDVAGSVPVTDAVQLVMQEVNSTCKELEIGYSNGQRQVVAVRERVASRDGSSRLRRGAVCVVSGGGRGVTNRVAFELAKRYGLILHLLGSAPLPDPNAEWRGLNDQQLRALKKDVAIRARGQQKSPADEWAKITKAMELDRNLRNLAAAGITAVYHQCDIRQRDQVANVMQAVRQQHGQIDGVIHGAGIEAACKFTRKKPELVTATLASKCTGAANLMDAVQQDPVSFFVSFGSTSGRFGGLGQADYSLASDLLAKMTASFGASRKDVTAVTFHWPAWDEVGMAVRPESKMALESAGISFMPVMEGVEHIVTELSTSQPASEVLILDDGALLDTDGTMSRAASQPQPASHVAPQAAPSFQSNGHASPCSNTPMIDTFVQTPGGYTATATLKPAEDPFLIQHKLRGKPFLPCVMSLEILGEAVSLVDSSQQVVALSNVQLKNGLTFHSDSPVTLEVQISQVAPGQYSCELCGPFLNARGQVLEERRVYVTATVETGNAVASLPKPAPVTAASTWWPVEYYAASPMFHGEGYQTLKEMKVCNGKGLGKLEAKPGSGLLGHRQGQHLVPAAELDGCLYACGVFAFAMVDGGVRIPHSIDRVEVVKLPVAGDKLVVQFDVVDATSDVHVYNFTVTSSQGEVLWRVSGYHATGIE